MKIDNEFKKLVPSLTGDEFEILEKNILERGIQDSIKVWQGIIIDGHNRYEIALRHNLHYDTKELCFESRQSVIEWMLNNQLGRRNLSPDQLSIIRGKLYNLNKMQGKRNDLTSGQNDHKLTTGQNLADKFKVSEKTVRRDAAFVNDNPEAAEKILKGEATKREIIQEQKRKERQESTKKVKPITGKYKIIYADPLRSSACIL